VQAEADRPTEHGYLRGEVVSMHRTRDGPTAPRGPDANVYRSGLWRLRRAEAMARRTVVCGSWTCRALAAGPRPASEAARISRSCPSVTAAAQSGASDFDPADVVGPGFCARRAPAAGAFCPASRPRRRSSAATAFSRRSNCSSPSRRSERPRSVDRARFGAFAGRSAGMRDLASGALVAVAGGKTVADPGAVIRSLDRARAKYADLVLVHGGGPGVERIAAQWAERNGVHQVVCKPDWQRHGRAAPFRRNDDLLATCCPRASSPSPAAASPAT